MLDILLLVGGVLGIIGYVIDIATSPDEEEIIEDLKIQEKYDDALVKLESALDQLEQSVIEQSLIEDEIDQLEIESSVTSSIE